MLRVDLNCDLGEGCGNDAAIMPYITSANIACGYHAGDAATMRETVEMAVEAGVNVGAHPGYRDRENFGRTDMHLPPKHVYKIVTDQIAALNEIARSAGTKLRHVKPHGALYNQAANDPELAIAIAEAVRDSDPDLILFGLSGSVCLDVAGGLGVRTGAEVFADRTYQPDGSLTPRSQPAALIHDPLAAADQALEIARNGRVRAIGNVQIPLRADTICIHGDSPNALDIVRAIRQALTGGGVEVTPL